MYISFFLSVFLDDGLIYSFGSNQYGALGRPTESGSPSPLYSAVPAIVKSLQDTFIHQVAAGNYHNLAVDVEGLLYVWGDNSEGQCGQGTLAEEIRPSYVKTMMAVGKVDQIAAGTFHSSAITSSGHLYTWGSGEDGCLGYFPETYTPGYVEVYTI